MTIPAEMLGAVLGNLLPRPGEVVLNEHFEGPAAIIADYLNVGILPKPSTEQRPPLALENLVYQWILEDTRIRIPGWASRLYFIKPPDAPEGVEVVISTDKYPDLQVSVKPRNDAGQGPATIQVNPLFPPEIRTDEVWIEGTTMRLSATGPIRLQILWS